MSHFRNLFIRFDLKGFFSWCGKPYFRFVPSGLMITGECSCCEKFLFSWKNSFSRKILFHTKNLFDFADPPHRRIDDYPFGGGSGMILKPEPIFRAIKYIKNYGNKDNQYRIIFPTPDGKKFNQKNQLI